jgi:hypothetical protein
MPTTLVIAQALITLMMFVLGWKLKGWGVRPVPAAIILFVIGVVLVVVSLLYSR